MRSILLLAFGLGMTGLGPGFARAATEPAVRLFVPDGQLNSHPIRVFVDRDLTPEMAPTLSCLRAQLVAPPVKWRTEEFPNMLLARHQTWIQTIDGQEVTVKGTLLMFDLRYKLEIPFYTAVQRVTPVLTWKEPSADAADAVLHRAVGGVEVYVGSILGALLWTGVVIVVLVVGIGWFGRWSSGTVWAVFLGRDGRLSLWRAQLAAWTVAIGSVVFCFGLTQLVLPEIPDTLVVLMGLSLATGGFGYVGSAMREDRADKPVKVSTKAKVSSDVGMRMGRLNELVCEYPPGVPQGQISIAKMQMLFWTVLMLVLFLVKGLQESKPWEVPWQMVALMGFSQAGYVGPKFFRGREGGDD